MQLKSIRYLLASIETRNLSLQQSSRSYFSLFAFISSIYWSWRHTIPCLIIFLWNKEAFVRRSNFLTTSTRQCFPTLTHAFSGGFFALKSVGSFKDLSKLSSTLQHLLTASDWAIGSGDIVAGSCVPSYRKAGCCRCWWGWTRRLTKENTTWSPVTPLLFNFAMTLRMHSTCWPPGPILDQFSWTWGRQELFLEVEIQSSRRETRISSIQFLYPLDHKLSTRPESQDEILVHIRQQHED